MSKRAKLGLWLLVAAVGLCSLVVYRKATALTAQPVLRLNFESKDRPIEGLNTFMRIPSLGHRHASVAIDQAGNFYLLARNRDLAAEKRVKHTPHATVMNVLVADTKGHIKRVVPLHRRNGQLVRYLCEFLTVSPSGKRWWTARRPYESLSDLREGSSPQAVLTAHDNKGKALQEWTLPINVDSMAMVQAVREDQVYVVMDDVFEPNDQQVWVYQIGYNEPQQRLQQRPELRTITGALVTPDGKLWALQSVGLVPSNILEVITMGLGEPARVFAKFRFDSSAKPVYGWILFGQEPSRGVFLYSYVPDDGDKNNADWRKKPKAIYRVDTIGVLHKLFETPDVLRAKLGYKVRAGQPLKADAHFVWMEVEYLKGNKVTEYQIVKVPYR